MRANIIQNIIQKLRTVLEPLPFVYAFWLEGADAHGRADSYSDLDLWLDVDGLDRVMGLCRHSLAELAPLDIDLEQPHPSPDIRQRMLHLSGSSPYLIIDLCLQRHGRGGALKPLADAAEIIFDKTGVVYFEASPEADLSAEVASLKEHFTLKQRWVAKELARGRFVEAISAYHAFSLAPLVRLLRLKHSPAKLGFGSKHLSYDLPPDLVERLERLYAVTSLSDLRAKHAEAQTFFIDAAADQAAL